jgi:hypothetical protein
MTSCGAAEGRVLELEPSIGKRRRVARLSGA